VSAGRWERFERIGLEPGEPWATRVLCRDRESGRLVDLYDVHPPTSEEDDEADVDALLPINALVDDETLRSRADVVGWLVVGEDDQGHYAVARHQPGLPLDQLVRNMARGGSFDIDYETFDGRALASTDEPVPGIHRARIVRVPPLRHEIAIGLVVEVAVAVQAIHEAGYVHGMLRPASILVDPSGGVAVAGLGTQSLEMRAMASTGSGNNRDRVSYMAPEFLRTAVADRRTDVFSLGAILYELLTFSRAFSRETTWDTIEALRNDDLRPPRSVAPHVPPAIDDLVMRCVSRDPGRRPPDMATLLTELRPHAPADARADLIAPGRGTGAGRKGARNVAL
jgi:serine/threonine protein kinase